MKLHQLKSSKRSQRSYTIRFNKFLCALLCVSGLVACSESNDSSDSGYFAPNQSTEHSEEYNDGHNNNARSQSTDSSFDEFAGEAGGSEYSEEYAAGNAGPQAPPPPLEADAEDDIETQTGIEQPEEDPEVNPFVDTTEDTLSTFSIDVDTASYTMTRRSLNNGQLPAPTRVRVEEFVNFFGTQDLSPSADAEEPFHVNLEVAPSPFGEDLHLLRVGVKGYEVPMEERQGANLVFLVDVSGSMSRPGKLDLIRYSLNRLTRMLQPTDTLSIVTYASRDEVILQPTPVSERSAIIDALSRLESGGGTNGAAGIQTAYELANSSFIEGGINRVILCTDGDFNVGIRDEALIQYVESQSELGINLTVLGYGDPNYFNDNFLEELSNRAEGQYSFIDSQNEALRVLGERLVGTLQVIAKDVKIQVEFNAETVSQFRLIGYENRVLNHQDFRDDNVDAGEIGSGHTVIALYELNLHPEAAEGSLATVRLRHKDPAQGPNASSVESQFEITNTNMRETFEESSEDLRFSTAVAEFAEVLRHSEHVAEVNFDRILEIANGALWWIDGDARPDREEFVQLVERAAELWSANAETTERD